MGLILCTRQLLNAGSAVELFPLLFSGVFITRLEITVLWQRQLWTGALGAGAVQRSLTGSFCLHPPGPVPFPSFP